MRSSTLAGACILAFAAPASASVVEVPGDYPTIQAAIWGAHSGDTILVQPGTYHESLKSNGKHLTLQSVAGAELTVIDATGLHGRVLTVTSDGTGDQLTLTGFTLTGGRTSGNDSGGGVFVDSGAVVSFEDCVIRDNVFDSTATDAGYGGGIAAAGTVSLKGCELRDNHVLGNGRGGGIAIPSGNGSMSACTIKGNSAASGGGAWHAYASYCTFEDNVAELDGGGLAEGGANRCTFRGNTAGGRGGGYFGPVPLSSCTFLGNSAATGGGAYAHMPTDWYPTISVANCIFAHNDAPVADGLFVAMLPAVSFDVAFCSLVGDSVSSPGGLSISHVISRDVPAGQAFISLSGQPVEVEWSDVSGGWPGTGNFDALPFFVAPDAGDYHLSLQSPCVDAGELDLPLYVFPYDDIDGQPRVMIGHVDIGADETEGDCNQNGQGDLDDIARGLSTDCDGDTVPDECEQLADCNGNGIPDLCDLDSGTSADCNHNGLPDECEPLRDCNGNGVPDGCDIAAHTSTDCDLDTVPDECQPLVDCNGNGVQDSCDLKNGDSHDCNANGLPDECDIAAGTSIDLNLNGWPDECESVLHVPSEYATIQAAIDAAASGDAIELAAGTYAGPGNVTLFLKGKQLTIEGPDAAGACVIDGDDTARFLGVSGYTDEELWLRRLTIRRMQGFSGAALGVDDGGKLDVRDCVFEDCQALNGGGAIFATGGSSVVLRGCTFTGNQAQRGGALRIVKAITTIEHGTFTGNVSILNGGAIDVGKDGSVTISDSIFRGDSGGGTDELHVVVAASLLAVSYSDVEGGLDGVGAPATAHVEWGPGMIDADPLFAAPPLDLHLLPGSPCINTGNPSGEPDADGSPPDMGALPYQPWTSLGGGIEGTFGLPVLAANGSLTGGSPLEWSVAHGWPGQGFSLVVGFSQAGLTLHGGVLWPQPQVILGLLFDADGAASGAGEWPAGWPAGTGIWLQAWFVDAGAVGGLAASNGVQGLAP